MENPMKKLINTRKQYLKWSFRLPFKREKTNVVTEH